MMNFLSFSAVPPSSGFSQPPQSTLGQLTISYNGRTVMIDSVPAHKVNISPLFPSLLLFSSSLKFPIFPPKADALLLIAESLALSPSANQKLPAVHLNSSSLPGEAPGPHTLPAPESTPFSKMKRGGLQVTHFLPLFSLGLWGDLRAFLGFHSALGF